MTDKARGRRGVDVLATIDISSYTQLVKDALIAFSTDTAYSIDMARAAATIESKRRVWRDRVKSYKVEEDYEVSFS